MHEAKGHCGLETAVVKLGKVAFLLFRQTGSHMANKKAIVIKPISIWDKMYRKNSDQINV